MKSILVLCSAFAIASAGVGTLSPEEEQHVLQLFNQACANGNERADMGGFAVFCKRSKQDFQETINHQVNVPASAQGPGQVVFVQPPPVKYQHNIQLNGSPGQGQAAKIYVLPQKASHQIATSYNPGQTVTSKPTVYFLNNKDAPQQPEQPRPPQYGPPAQAPVPTPQEPQRPPQYGPPAPAPAPQGPAPGPQGGYSYPVPAPQGPQEGYSRYSAPVLSTIDGGYF